MWPRSRICSNGNWDDACCREKHVWQKSDGHRAHITIGGRLAYQSTYTGLADGKTLTETGIAVGTTEKYKAVYDRQ
jgi:hypothetical protein